MTDLGGDSRAGARQDDEAIFAIRAGSAVTSLVFNPGTTTSVELRRVRGTRADKLAALTTGPLPPLEAVAGTDGDPFGPLDWGSLGHGITITRIFRGHFPGVKTHRDDLIVNVDRMPWLPGYSIGMRSQPPNEAPSLDQRPRELRPPITRSTRRA